MKLLAMLSLAAAYTVAPMKLDDGQLSVKDMLQQRNEMHAKLLSISKYRNSLTVKERENIHCGIGVQRSLPERPTLPQGIYFSLNSAAEAETALVNHIRELNGHIDALTSMIYVLDSSIVECLSKKIR